MIEHGGGSMGSHKHGVSGHAAKHNKTKLLTSMVVNRLRRRRRLKAQMVDAREIEKILK
jgi:hypothetical protein